MSYDGTYSGVLAARRMFAHGLKSPISTQGEITQNVLADTYEYRLRHRNSTVPNRVASSYPGGTIPDNVHIKTHELVYGWKQSARQHSASAMRLPGSPTQMGFTSLNGLYYGDTKTEAELEERMYLIGQTKSDYNFEDTDQLKHGFAVMAVGSGSTYNTGYKDLHSGDKICWKLVPFHTRNQRSAQLGYQIPVHGFVDKPRGKLMPMTVPYNYRDTKYTLQRAYHTLTSTGADSAANLSLSALEPMRGVQNELSPNKEHALAVKQFVLMSMARGIDALATRGVVKVVTPSEAKKQKIVDDLVLLVKSGGSLENIKAKVDELDAVANTTVSSALVNANYDSQDIEKKNYPHFFNMKHIRDAAKREKAKSARQEASLFMAVKLGLVKSDKAGSRGLQENKMWVEDIIKSAMFSYDPHPKVQKLYRPTFDRLTKANGDFEYSGRMEVQYYQRAKDYLNMAEAGMTRAKESIDRRVIGRALNYSKAAEQLDLIIGHT
jgi:hypothetical protein